MRPDDVTYLPPDAAEVISHFLQRADVLLPGRIEGYYLAGSLALDDYQPGQSDVDFVAVTESLLRPTELDLLRQLHAALHEERAKPSLDGVYVTWQQLADDPTILSAPFSNEGHFGANGGFAANIVTWHTLRQKCVRVRGPDQIQVWHDDGVLRSWCRANLSEYWMGWVRAARQKPRRWLYALTPAATLWGILGVTRLHATITSGDILSKSAAGHYALLNFPAQWTPIIETALAIRNGEGTGSHRNAFARRRDMLTYMDFVIADALERR